MSSNLQDCYNNLIFGLSSGQLSPKWILEGSISDYEIFLDYGRPWCNDDPPKSSVSNGPHCWSPTLGASAKHLGIDIKLKREHSSNSEEPSNENFRTSGKEVYTAFDGYAIRFEPGGDWGGAVYVAHEKELVNGEKIRFFSIYFHITPVESIEMESDVLGTGNEGINEGNWEQLWQSREKLKMGDLIGHVADLNPELVHDRDHLHFALRCLNIRSQNRCGGDAGNHLFSENPTGGYCLDPKIIFSSFIGNNIQSCKIRTRFYDIYSKDWYEYFIYDNNEAEGLYSRGIIQGEGNGNFNPSRDVTKAEFVKMLVVASSVTLESEPDDPQDFYESFGQVNGEWFYPYIVTAWNSGWINRDVVFLPSDNVKRAEAVELLVSALDIYDPNVTPEKEFTDVFYGLWYYNYVYSLTKFKIIGGYDDNTFKPNQVLNRAEAAKIIFLSLHHFTNSSN